MARERDDDNNGCEEKEKERNVWSHEAFDFRLNKRAFGWLHIDRSY